MNFYAFAPFSLIGAAIAKVRKEKCSWIIIIPWWKTQFLFPMMVPLLKNFQILLPPKILTLSSKRSTKHPLYPNMKLLAVHSSGKASETQTFHKKLQMFSQICGEQPPEVGTNQFSGNGFYMQVQGTWIPVLLI